MSRGSLIFALMTLIYQYGFHMDQFADAKHPHLLLRGTGSYLSGYFSTSRFR